MAFLTTAVLASLLATSAAAEPVAAATPPETASAPETQAAPTPRAVTAAGVKAIVAERAAEATLVNVWASWCVPCRKEMPDLLALRRELKPRGFELLLVTADFEDSVPDAVTFLTSLGADFPTYHKRQKDQEFIDGLDRNWTGSLPFSALFDSDGRLVKTWEGSVSRADVETAAGPLLAAAASTEGVAR